MSVQWPSGQSIFFYSPTKKHLFSLFHQGLLNSCINKEKQEEKNVLLKTKNKKYMETSTRKSKQMFFFLLFGRSPSLGSGSLSMDEERREERYRYGQHDENNRSTTSIDHEVPEIYIPQPEFLTRMPTSELRSEQRHSQFYFLLIHPNSCHVF